MSVRNFLFSSRIGVLFVCGAVALAVTGCSGIGSMIGFGKKSEEGYSKRVVSYGQRVPKGGGRYKIGKPYKIAGEWYYPREDARYDRTGIGSWYGRDFHGRYTANGEVFDMDALTAAHPTLPMPVYAKVTNLENGRSLVVRINDRGPYKHNRVIDLSRRAANELGYVRQGTARVRVQYLAKAPLDGDDRYERHYLAQQRWRARPYAARKQDFWNPRAVGSVSTSRETRVPTQWRSQVAQTVYDAGHTAAVSPQGRIFVKVGAFREAGNAERLRQKLSGVGPVNIVEQVTTEGLLYRVSVGPFADKHMAGTALQQVSGLGIHDAVIDTK